MAIKRLTDIERFVRSVAVLQSGCWDWMLARDRDGYGFFKVGSYVDGTRRMVRAHRWAYEQMIGPIPNGLQIDHLCRNRSCVNPSHCEPVTGLVNARRGMRGMITHCPSGHAYVGRNLIVRRGRRHCRECQNRAAREHGHRTNFAAQRAFRQRQKEGVSSGTATL